MLKCYPPHSVQRSQLAEAIAIASKIAKCEPNEQTIRATVMYCLERNVEGFPVSCIYQGGADDRQIYSATTVRTSTLSMWTKRILDRTTHPLQPPYLPSRPQALQQPPVLPICTAHSFSSTTSLWSSNANQLRSRGEESLDWMIWRDSSSLAGELQ
jgi:hypothetical protein